MHEGADILSDVVILFGTAVAVGWAFRLVKAPSIIGFLITGVVIGPYAVGLIQHDQVDMFAEAGLVLLLFTIGLELSPKPLLKTGPQLLVTAFVQIGVTAGVATLAVAAFGAWNAFAAVILGVGVSLSSTAIVLKQLSDRGEIRSAAGRISTGVLLLQDVFVISVMLVLPFLGTGGGGAEEDAGEELMHGVMGLLGLSSATVAARFALPYLLDTITRHGGRELTTLFAVLMAGGGAWVAQLAGWPPALGACIAGLLLADADLRHQFVAEITPFRDVFNALFFISLGMLVNLQIVAQFFPWLFAAIVATLLVKTLITCGAVAAAGWPLRLGIQVGLGLCTVSEFSYVLAREAYSMNLLPEGALSLLIPHAVGTMLLGAGLVPLAGPISNLIARGAASKQTDPNAEGHESAVQVIIIGYGMNGENLARVLRATHISYRVVEMSSAHARQARDEGADVLMGDATRSSILHESGIDTARALVIAINDVVATRRIVAQARTMRPDLYILVRTETAGEIEELRKAGANDVVPADFEVSIKMFAHVLTELRIPDNVVQAQIAAVRAGGYGVLRGAPVDQAAHLGELLQVFRLTATQTFYLSEESPACGATIAGLNLRARTGVNIIAVVREGTPNPVPPGDFEMKVGDVLVLVGSHAQLAAAHQLLSGKETGETPNRGGGESPARR